jgi:hypothetical protein
MSFELGRGHLRSWEINQKTVENILQNGQEHFFANGQECLTNGQEHLTVLQTAEKKKVLQTVKNVL